MVESLKEVWRLIPCYTNYVVSNLGRVRRLESWKERKQNKHQTGYMAINLHNCDGQRTKRVHRLVMAAFEGESELEVNHKNGIKTDNRLVNLEYCTRSENQLHRYRVLGVANGNISF